MGAPTHYDAIVLGVGAMGSAALYHLAQRGLDVLGIEQFDIPHELGSSGGVTRIYRLAYQEHPVIRPPHAPRPRPLGAAPGAGPGKPSTAPPAPSTRARPEARCSRTPFSPWKEHGLRHEVMDASQLAARFPGYRLPDHFQAIYQPDGGFLLADRCIVAHAAAAQSLSAEIHGRERVLEWEARGDSVRVSTDRADYETEQLVIAAGAWASKQVPYLAPVAEPERQVLAWFQPLRPRALYPRGLPGIRPRIGRGQVLRLPRRRRAGLQDRQVQPPLREGRPR